MEVKSFVTYDRRDTLSQGTLLNVAVKKEINNANSGLDRNGIFTLDLPCTGEKLQKPGYKLLLVTDVDVQPPQKRFYLGDSDVLLPYTQKIQKIVKRKLNFCNKHIVKNILSILEKKFKSKNGKRTKVTQKG
jgi:hypothetical protein